MSTARRTGRSRWAGLAAAGMSAAVFALWLGMVVMQEGATRDEAARYVIVGVVLLAWPALALASSLVAAPTVRLALLTSAASGMLVWGLLAIFSVGLLLIGASVFAWIAVADVARTGGDRVPATLAAVGVVVLTLAYLATA